MNIEQKMELFRILRLVSGILAIIFILLTIFLIWRFKIWQIFLERSGIARKKSISQMHQVNAATGRMIRSSSERVAAQEFTDHLSGDLKKERRSKRTGAFGSGRLSAALSKGEQKEDAPKTPQPEASAETAVLEPSEPTPEPEQPAAASPEVPPEAQNAANPVSETPLGTFVLTDNRQFIHTNEALPEVDL